MYIYIHVCVLFIYIYIYIYICACAFCYANIQAHYINAYSNGNCISQSLAAVSNLTKNSSASARSSEHTPSRSTHEGSTSDASDACGKAQKTKRREREAMDTRIGLAFAKEFPTPQKPIWNLKIPSWTSWKRRNIYKPPIFGFHVSFRVCVEFWHQCDHECFQHEASSNKLYCIPDEAVHKQQTVTTISIIDQNGRRNITMVGGTVHVKFQKEYMW